MSEAKEPEIHVSGTVTEQDYTTAARARGAQLFWKFMLVYLLLLLFIHFITNFYYWYPYLRDGRAAYSDFFHEAWKTFFSASPASFMMIGFLVLYALYLIVFRPLQGKKRLHELHPEGLPVVYDFYEDQLVVRSATQTSDETYRLKYADVQRKIKETKFLFILATAKRNKIGLFKAVMSPDNTESIRKLLNERCPQRKSRK